MRSRIILGALLSGAVLLGVLAGTALRSGGSASSPRADGPANREAEAPAAGTDERAPTVAGAREAALSYASASQDWLYLDDAAIGEAVRQITAPGVADRLVRQTVSEISVVRDALVQAAGPVWWFVRPLASQVSVEDDRARASVWVVTVLSAADVALPQADWLTVDVELVWRGGRWLLESIVDRPGPTPMSGVRDEPWQPEPFDEALRGFERLGSEAVG